MSDETPKYRWPWVLLLVFLLAILLAVLWMSAEVKRMRRIRDLSNPQTVQTHKTNNPSAIILAAKTYTDELTKRGETIPAWVAVRELINRRLLRVDEIDDFGGADVFVALKEMNESNPEEILMEARFTDGTKIVVLADGSIQQRR